MMPGHPPVLVAGDVMLDYTIEIAAGEHDEKRDVVASATAPGGTAANTAAALVLLGVPVMLAATVGDDCAGRECLSHLAALGVDTTHVAVRPGPTGRATIVVDGPNRHVYVDRGVSDAPLSGLPRTRYAYVSAPATVNPSELLGATLVLGVEHQMVTASLGPHLAAAGVVVTNQLGAARLATFAPDATVVETRGDRGATVHRPGHAPVTVPTERIDAIDATGAGDAFAAGFLAALAVGAGVVDAAAIGNHMGAAAARQRGAMLRAVPAAAVAALEGLPRTSGRDTP